MCRTERLSASDSLPLLTHNCNRNHTDKSHASADRFDKGRLCIRGRQTQQTWRRSCVTFSPYPMCFPLLHYSKPVQHQQNHSSCFIDEPQTGICSGVSRITKYQGRCGMRAVASERANSPTAPCQPATETVLPLIISPVRIYFDTIPISVRPLH